jgi:hypothetical protein
MTSIARKSIATVFAGTVLAVGVASPASAQPPIQIQDGLVNVAIGDVTVQDTVDIGVAAQVVAQICGLKVGPVAVLATQVDRSGETDTVCMAQADQDVELDQINIVNN